MNNVVDISSPVAAGRSAELVSVFQNVTEIRIGGEAKFSSSVCRKLAKVISCRIYAPAILELCHLIAIAEACGDGQDRYEALFWDSGPACTASFRRYVRVNLGRFKGRGAEFHATTGGVDIDYADGRFTVTYGRMAFLSALMEFLVTALDYRLLDDLFQVMFADTLTRASVSKRANDLSRLIYHYLKEHLPTAQNQRKFHRLVKFLSERGADGGASSLLDDEAVLEFWLAESATQAEKTIEFKTFRSVFLSFVRLYQSLEEIRDMHALEFPKPLGTDGEAGEINPEVLFRLVETVEETHNPLATLRDTPAKAIKFLNNREMEVINLLMECGRTALALPLSLIRCEVFGRSQGRITQALRSHSAARRPASTTPAGLIDADFIEQSVTDTYLAHSGRLKDVAAQVDKVLFASFYALAQARNAAAITLLVVLRPDLDLQVFRRHLPSPAEIGGNVVALDEAALSRRFLASLEDSAKVGSEVSSLVSQAKNVFRKMSRRGFVPDADPEVVRGFVAGTQALLEIKKQIQTFKARLEHLILPQNDWTLQLEADRTTFLAQFHLLYGDAR